MASRTGSTWVISVRWSAVTRAAKGQAWSSAHKCSFLPVLGFEFIPIGLLLIAQDVPFLRKPVGEFTLWLERKWVALRRWWRERER